MKGSEKMQDYSSKTERIQNYIREILDDKEKHSIRGIIDHVDAKLRETGEFVFQINSYVNAAMRLLLKNEDYVKVARGVCQKGGVPYTPVSHVKESDLEKITFRNTMISIKAYARKFDELFSQKPPLVEMDTDEETSYRAIKKQSLDVAKNLRINADKILHMADARYESGRNGVIRKYFKECLADGNPHTVMCVSNTDIMWR